MNHLYPEDFARFLADRWGTQADGALGGVADPLPPLEPLTRVMAVAYHASFLQNELRPLRFRAILREPARFPAGESAPHGFHTMLFTELRLFDETLIRQLAHAVDYSSALLGIGLKGAQPVIWGLIRSGPRWLRETQGQIAAKPLPDSLILHVLGPGWLVAGCGDAIVGELRGGSIRGHSMDVFQSLWLPEAFAAVRADVVEEHSRQLSGVREARATLDGDVVRHVTQQMLRRCLTAVRDAQHGGMIVIVPPQRVPDVLGRIDFVDLRFAFADGEPRRRFRTLTLQGMAALARAEGQRGRAQAGWREYEAASDPELTLVDEAVFEIANFLADLTAIDGAVIMTQRFEILGFGAEISARLPPVDLVARSLDLEGTRYVLESTDHVGTRHRSAYRLAYAMPDAVIVVVSQDGSIRFVRWHDGRVTYWDHAML